MKKRSYEEGVEEEEEEEEKHHRYYPLQQKERLEMHIEREETAQTTAAPLSSSESNLSASSSL